MTNPRPNKVLIFSNAWGGAPGECGAQALSCGSHVLASALEKAGVSIVFAPPHIGPASWGRDPGDRDDLLRVLQIHKDINFILITLSEFYFQEASRLIHFLKQNARAFIVVGGPMPTLTPHHVLAHLPEADILVRGLGEEVLPKIIAALSGKTRLSPLGPRAILGLRQCSGMALAGKDRSVACRLDHVNSVECFDRSPLSFNFFTEKDFKDGLYLFTSWGCLNACFFCTSVFKKRPLTKSLACVKSICEAYLKRARAVFAGVPPPEAMSVAFYDDDFLVSPERAMGLFTYFKKSPLKINFFQTGVNSFFLRSGARGTPRLHEGLIRSITPDIFADNKDVHIYLGVENLSDDELRRLGKGYEARQAVRVIEALADRGVKTACHFIASNRQTRVNDLFINLRHFAMLQHKWGPYFRILTPIIPYLVPLFPSQTYKKRSGSGRNSIKTRQILKKKRERRFDYPLVEHDVPASRRVAEIIPFLEKEFKKEHHYARIYDHFLCRAAGILARRHSSGEAFLFLRDRARLFSRRSDGRPLTPCLERNNIQLMVTRRCHLRCSYCPVSKEDKDMSEGTLMKAIDLLFSSSQKDVRLDFTGGEPLLRFDLIKKAVQYSKVLARRKNKNISFYMVSNLIALTQEMAAFLKQEDFFLELSIDGTEKTHNLFKRSKICKLNPYRATTSKLPLVQSNGIAHYAVMVVTPQTTRHLYGNFYHLLRLGIRNIGINYALCSYWRPTDVKSFITQCELIFEEIRPFLKNARLRLTNLGSRDEPAILNSEVMVDTDGTVHLLTDWLFEKIDATKVPPLGSLGGLKALKEIQFTKTQTLIRMLRFAPRHKDIIFNNVETGYRVSEALHKWKN